MSTFNIIIILTWPAPEAAIIHFMMNCVVFLVTFCFNGKKSSLLKFLCVLPDKLWLQTRTMEIAVLKSQIILIFKISKVKTLNNTWRGLCSFWFVFVYNLSVFQHITKKTIIFIFFSCEFKILKKSTVIWKCLMSPKEFF